MATYVDPAAGALAQAIGVFGQGLARNLNREAIRERELTTDPNVLQGLVPAATAAQEKGPEALAAFERALGVRPGFATTNILSFAPTEEQATSMERMKLGLPKLAAGNAVLKATMEQDSLEAGLELNLPMLQALGLKEEYIAQAAKGKFDGEYFTIASEEGIPKVQVTTDKARLEALAEVSGVQADHVRRYADAINSIDQSTPAGRKAVMMATAFIANPGFANYLAQQEEMDLRVRLQQMASAPTLEGMLGITTTVLTKHADAVETLRKAEEEGAPQDELETLRAAVNNWANIGQLMQNSQLMLGADMTFARPGRSFWGSEKGNEFLTSDAYSLRIRQIAAQIKSGEASLDQYIKHADDPRLIRNERERQQFEELVASLQAAEGEGEQEGASSDSPGVALAKTARLAILRERRQNVMQMQALDPVEKFDQLQRLDAQIQMLEEQQSIYQWLNANLPTALPAATSLMPTAIGGVPR